jgi:PAS domain S-box-containing protein
MKQELHILILEDVADDAELMMRELRREGLQFTAKRVWTEADFLAELRQAPDVILADYSLPAYDGLSALNLAAAECPDVPFIFVSGSLGEETAIDALHHGARDYVLKQKLARLGPAVRRALLDFEEKKELKRAEEERDKILGWQRGINRIQHSLLAPAPLADKLRNITESIFRLFDADFCRVWLIRPGDLCERGCVHAEVKEGPHDCRHRDRCLHLLASSGRYTHLDGQVHRRVPFGAYKIGRIASGEEHKFLSNDVTHDSLVHNHQWAREFGLVSFAGYQLRIPGGETLGVLALFAKHPILPAEDALLDGLSSTLAQVIRQAQAEEALRASEEKHRVLFESSRDAIMSIEPPAWKFTSANSATLKMYGARNEEEFVSLGPWELSPDRQPDGCDSAEKAREMIETALREGACSFEWTHRRIGGEEFSADVLLTRMELGGKVMLQACVRDITERNRVEGQLRKLAQAVDQSPVSIVITDRAGNIEFVNPKFTRITGYTLEEALGQNPRLLKSGETPAEEYRQLWETILAGKEWWGEFHNKRKDGTLFWETATISPIRDAADEITHFIAVKEDITEIKLLQSKFLRAQRLESIGSLASGIAHDLNNILAPILLCAPMLKMGEQDENRLDLAQTIESSAQQAAGIVKQLLGFARGKEGQRNVLQVRHLIRDIAKIARETFPRSIQVEDACASELWLVRADATQIHQVLLNLCVNARDAMPTDGKLSIRAENVTLDEHFVSMHREAIPGPYVRIQVADTGTGIPDALCNRIFESFFTTKGEGQGTGLGLTTVQGIVRDHGGFITFTTAPGKGTTFVVHLPAVPEAQALAETAQSGGSIPRGQGEMVLVADDEPAILETTRRTLEFSGYTVLSAQDGIQALAKFSAHQGEVRAVVTDFMMPLMDGVTLCRTLRVLSPRTPLIVSSGGLFGKPGGDALRTFEELGIRHILHKPHTAEVLLRTLSEVLQYGQTAVPGEGAA